MLVASAFQWRAAAALAVGLAFAVPNRARAALIWDWAFSRTDINASGTFTTFDTPDEAGYYLITSISGSRNGVAITGLQPAGTPIPGNEPYAVDDLVSISGPQLTVSGFGFALADGTYSNPFYANFLCRRKAKLSSVRKAEMSACPGCDLTGRTGFGVGGDE